MIRLMPLVVLVLAGCGESSMRPNTVEGTVTLDGKPLSSGTISLLDPDGRLPGDGGVVTEGRFAFSASTGQKRVEIRVSKMMPGTKDSQGQPELREYLPSRYHDRSVLTAEIRSGSPNHLTFDLKSAGEP